MSGSARVLVLTMLLSAGSWAAASVDAALPSPPGADETTASGDPVAAARTLATTGRRNEALARLSEYLGAHPGDSDARILYGTVLSWEGRYDEARAHLADVLAKSPTNGDALGALINVEMWSAHPEEAEALTRRALAVNSRNASLLLSRARALDALNRPRDASAVVAQALVLEPRNEQTLRLKRSLEHRLRQWRAATSVSGDWFSDQRAAWRETQTSISRAGTPAGTVIGTISHADRFGSSDNQLELEAYPRLRPGTYAYVDVGTSPNAELYPSYRLAGDVYQSLGAGFEASVGMRRLGFTTPVNIYVSTLSKYHGGWLLVGRAFFVPDQSEGSRSFHGSVRRYLGGGESYLGVRYGRGFARQELVTTQDFTVLNSDTVAGETSLIVGARWVVSASASVSRQERALRDNLMQYSLSAGVSVRF